jgi:hypothetical protein
MVRPEVEGGRDTAGRNKLKHFLHSVVALFLIRLMCDTKHSQFSP